MNISTAKLSRYHIVISILLLLHLSAVLLALAANLSSSAIQRRAISFTSWYLRTLNFQMGLVPIELTHGNEVSDTFLIQVHYEGEPADRWNKGPWHQRTWESGNRAGRLAQAMAFRAERSKEEENQEDVVLNLATALLLSANANDPSSKIDRIRVIREIAYPREQVEALLQSPESSLPEYAVHFDAKAVWISDTEVNLHQEVESRRSSKSVPEKRATPPKASDEAKGDRS